MLVNALITCIYKTLVFAGLSLKTRTPARVMKIIMGKKTVVQDINIGAWIPDDSADSALAVVAL